MKLLFYHDHRDSYQLQGTRSWHQQLSKPTISIIQGQFLELNGANVQINVKLYGNNEKLYFEDNGKFKSQNLNLTVMEDIFYLRNGQKVYQLKLMRQNCITLLYTYNMNLFVQFYCFLAKYCILTDFKKRFKVLNQIGVGSSCHVYTGINIYSNEVVALKVLDKQYLLKDTNGVSLITNQITNLERLKQYHLSPLIQIFQTLDCIVLVLQKAQAGNMIEYISTNVNHYNAKLIQIILMKVLTNLKELHSAGFIHRDIKPENILFDTNSLKSSVFLADFGLSVRKSSQDTNSIGKKCSGTMGFVAPQVLQNNVYDEKCDIFSCGCLFYFMMTGHSLFNSSQYSKIYFMTINQQYIRKQTNKLLKFGSEAIQLMQMMLEIDPLKRISAEDTLKHHYFNQMQNYHICTDPNDNTSWDFITNKIQKFWANP